MPWLGRNAEARGRPLGPADLAQPRNADLPTGGRYDHASQELKGYNQKVAQSAAQSDTRFDGERQ
jgi:hypothetical protein